MRFEWDEAKNRRNLAKHRISFEIVKSMFEDPFALSFQDRVVEGGERWQTLGAIGDVVVVLVANKHEEVGNEDDPNNIGAEGNAAGKESI
jgi:uncharacterized protein